MTRKKVKLAYITSDSARKATFKKRKKGLVKKVSELTTLCGIEACAIIYSPYDAQPEVWPSPMGVQHVLSQFKNMPEMEQSKKMVNQESFIRQRIGKGNEQLKKQRKENREKEVTQVMFQCLTGRTLTNLNMMDLNDLGWIIDQYLKDIYKQVDTITKEINSQVTAATVPPPLPPLSQAGPIFPPLAQAGPMLPPLPQARPILPSILPPLPQAGLMLPPLPTLPQTGPILPPILIPHTGPILPPPPPPETLASGMTGPIGEVALTPPQQGGDRQASEGNMEAMQRQQWMMDLINPNENMGFVGDDVMLPFTDNNPNSLWSSAFFP